VKDPPDSITIEEFMGNEKYGRSQLSKSRNPYTCGLTGKTYSAKEVKSRTAFLARAISRKLGFSPNEGTEWDKVVCVYSLNAVRSLE
jgi:hypothetical protein